MDTGELRGGFEEMDALEAEGNTRASRALNTLSMFSNMQTTLLRISATSEEADFHSGMVWQIEESMRSPIALHSSRILFSRSRSLCFYMEKMKSMLHLENREIGRKSSFWNTGFPAHNGEFDRFWLLIRFGETRSCF